MQVTLALVCFAVLYWYIFGFNTASVCSNNIGQKTFFKDLDYRLEICDPTEDVAISVAHCAVLCTQKNNCAGFSMTISGQCRLCLSEKVRNITAHSASELWLIRNVMVTNPVKGVQIPTPGGLPVGTIVIITGTPTSKEKSTIDIVGETDLDIMLRFIPRFNEQNVTSRVGLSHRINGDWDAPSYDGLFSLEVNVKFKLIVLFTEADIKIYVDDIYFHSKEYVFNSTDIKYITYDNAIELQELSF